jgi:drug/metabolite transporter (DMT)-like permease
MLSNSQARTYTAFLGAVLIGGANFIAVSFSNRELPPFFGAALRYALAGVLFFLIRRLGRLPRPGQRSILGAILYGLLNFGATYGLLYYALVGLTAGTASVIMATVPLFTLMFAVLVGQERFTVRGIVGGILAVAGIAVLSAGRIGGDLDISYLVAAVFAAAAGAGSSVVAKGLPEVHPVNMNAFGMVAGAGLLAAGSLIAGEPWSLPRASQTWIALSWLVIAGSMGLFQLFLYVIKRLTASATTYAVASMPLVAVVLGVLLLEQPVTLEVVIGGLLILSAVYVGAISGKRRAVGEAVPDQLDSSPEILAD